MKTEQELYTEWSDRYRKADETGNYYTPYSTWRDREYPSTYNVIVYQVYSEIRLDKLSHDKANDIVTSVKRNHVMNFDYTEPGAYSEPKNYTINPAFVQSVVVSEVDVTTSDPWR